MVPSPGRLLIILSVLCGLTWGASADELSYYLPDSVEYDPDVPTPQSVLGWEIGDRHLRHHELMRYMSALAKASDRVTLREYGQTYGNRPLLVLTITSQANHGQLEDIRQEHLDLSDPARAESVDIEKQPVVISLCYGVHGDESSASNCSPLVAYYLAAAQGEHIDELLDNTIILLDPCLNPDGFDRFAAWANANRGAIPNPDSNHREHNQPWPGGRTNYYFFDLNRDWLPAQHPESRGRLKTYHRWKPNIQNDYHEMGTNSSYFFQPGVPERTNPLTPRENIDLTRRIARFHAGALDELGSSYFTEEQFDDFYMGKGSTYPDLHGCIGILFEQASSRGHVQDSENGELTFGFTIRNQFTTTLSTFDAAINMRDDLLDYQRRFYADSLKMGEVAEIGGYIFTTPGDPDRANRFVDLLLHHDIWVHELTDDVTRSGELYRAGESFLVPTAQPEYRFVQSVFEKRTEFEENIFYDVSAWTLPLAFNLQYDEIERGEELPAGDERLVEVVTPAGPSLEKSTVAYVIDWRSRLAARVVNELLAEGVRLRVAQKSFVVDSGEELMQFHPGDVLVPVGGQAEKAEFVYETLRAAGEAGGISVTPVASGLTPEGVDLGSGSFVTINKPRVLLVSGQGTSSNSVGEVWHLLDKRHGVPVTMVDVDRLGRSSLADYTVVVMTGGSYSDLGEGGIERIKRYVREGGTLVATGSATQWAIRAGLSSSVLRERAEEESDKERRPLAEAQADRAKHMLSGAILGTDVDRTHPIGFGFVSAHLPVILNQGVFLEPSPNPYSTPVAFDATDPLLSGYASDENLETVAGSAAVVVESHGRGRIVLMTINPTYRAHWYATERLLLNAVFFGPAMRTPGGPGDMGHH